MLDNSEIQPDKHTYVKLFGHQTMKLGNLIFLGIFTLGTTERKIL